MLNNMHPTVENRVYELVVETIAKLDVDILVRMRKGTHLVKTSLAVNSKESDSKVLLNNVLQKIESKQLYSLRMSVRNQDEKEIKVELLLRQFMKSLDDKINLVNQSGRKNILKFSEFFMSLCITKILDVSRSNFVQYITLFMVLRAKRHIDKSTKPLEKDSCCELLFTTCFISHLI